MEFNKFTNLKQNLLMQQKSQIGENIIRFHEIDSTNNYAMHLINEGMAEHGMVILSDFQTKGKGQLGNLWISEDGKNLLCSIIIDTKGFAIENQFVLNCMTCVCIAEILMQEYNIPNVSIKWPNDIYAGNRKIAGILIENSLRGNIWTFAILGIGLNVNQMNFQNIQSVTSLKIESKQEIQISELLQFVMKKLNDYFLFFYQKTDSIMQLYNSYLMYRNEVIQFKLNNKIQEGTLYRVNELGQIEMLVDEKLIAFQHKEIQLIIKK